MLVGGIDPHRHDLSSMIMLKDNHIWSSGTIYASSNVSLRLIVSIKVLSLLLSSRLGLSVDSVYFSMSKFARKPKQTRLLTLELMLSCLIISKGASLLTWHEA